MKRPSVTNVAAVLMAVFVGVALGQNGGPVQTVTVRDTVTAAIYEKKVADLLIERDGIKARLEDVQARPPATIYVVDTLVLPPDTVLGDVRVEGGKLSFEVLLGTDSIALRTPELHAGSDISDCDEGFAIQAGTVVCDRARFGHLYLGVTVGTRSELGAWWEPSYRSPWEVSAGFDGRMQLRVRRGLKVF